MNPREPCEPFGPEYPQLSAAVAKFRAMARRRGGLKRLTHAERRAYGAAVHKAFVSLNTKVKGLPAIEPRPHCASRTVYSDGRKIAAAIRQQHLSALRACPAAERRSRSPLDWELMYAKAMVARHGRKWVDANRDRMGREWPEQERIAA